MSNQAYRQTDAYKEQARRYSRTRWKEHPEKVLESVRKYQAANPEKVRRWKAESLLRCPVDPVKKNLSAAKYRAANKEKIRLSNRLYKAARREQKGNTSCLP